MTVGKIEHAPDYRSHRPAKHWDSIARRYVEGGPAEELAKTTFGTLENYLTPDEEAEIVAYINSGRWPYLLPTANDNVIGKSPVSDNAPLVATATRKGAQESDDTLWRVRDLSGFVYLGSPYSKYRLGHDTAAYEVSVAAALLMRRGLRVYAPISHGHFVSKHADLPQTWDFWKEQCQPMIDAAAGLIVLQMHGWAESVGLVYEIGEFERAGKPVVYWDPRVPLAKMEVAA